MFLKISTFHFLDVVGPGMGIGGAAVLLAAASIFAYSRLGRAPASAGVPNRYFFRRLGVLGFLLIGTGFLARAFWGGADVLDERYGFKAPANDDVGRIYYQPVIDGLTIPLKDMIRKNGYKILKDPEKMEMNRNGYIETPFVFYEKGGYTLEFTAKGTEELKQRSRILVGFLALGKTGTELIGDPVVYELAPSEKKIEISFPKTASRHCAVRIEFLNATTTTKNLFRVVTISNVVLRKAEER